MAFSFNKPKELDPLEAADYALSYVESMGSGGYDAVGPVMESGSYAGDRAYGKHQVMGKNIPSWTEQYYGVRMTPDQYLKNPAAQDAVFRGKFGESVDKYGNMQDAASVWFTGQPYDVGENRDDTYITGEQYVGKFNQGLRRFAEERGFSADQITQYVTKGPALSYSPEQSSRMVDQASSGTELSYPGLPRMEQPGSLTDPRRDELFAAIRAGMAPQPMLTAPQPPMTGPRTGLTMDQSPRDIPRIDTAPQVRTSPKLGEGMSATDIRDTIMNIDPEVLSDENIDSALPTDENTPNASSALHSALKSSVNPADYSLGEGDVPASVKETVKAAQTDPNSGKTQEEKDKITKRRKMAADMLEVLSVGLGQLAAGEAVDVSGPLAGQRERAVQQNAIETQRRDQAALAQQLSAAGLPQLAALAMTSPKGYETAMSAYSTLMTQKPSKVTGVARMSPQQRMEYFTQVVGVDGDLAKSFAANPDLGDKYLEQVYIPELKDREVKAGIIGEAEALFDKAAPLAATNPAIATALTSMTANPTADTVENLRTVMQDAGEDLPSRPMNDFEANVAAKKLNLTPEEVDLAKADPVYAEKIRGGMEDYYKYAGRTGGELGIEKGVADQEAAELVDAGILSPQEGEVYKSAGPDEAMKYRTDRLDREEAAAQRISIEQQAASIGDAFLASNPDADVSMFRNVRTASDLANSVRVASKIYGNTETIKTALAATKDPKVRQMLLDLGMAEAGVAMSPAQEASLKTTMERLDAGMKSIDDSAPLKRAMLTFQQIADSPDYTGGGPVTENLLYDASRILEELGLDGFAEDFVNPTTSFGLRLLNAYQGQFFMTIRPEGTGQVSDAEGQRFVQAFPSIGDNKIKQLGMAQKILFDIEAANEATLARQEWVAMNDKDPAKQTDARSMEEYVNSRVEKKMGKEVFPTLDPAAIAKTGRLPAGLSTTTVVKVGGEYTTVGDYMRELGI